MIIECHRTGGTGQEPMKAYLLAGQIIAVCEGPAFARATIGCWVHLSNGREIDIMEPPEYILNKLYQIGETKCNK